MGAKILIYNFFKVGIDGFEPYISQVNMIEVSRSIIINHKLKAWYMKELNSAGVYILTYNVHYW